MRTIGIGRPSFFDCADLSRRSAWSLGAVATTFGALATRFTALVLALVLTPSVANAMDDHLECFKVKDQAKMSIDLQALTPFQPEFGESDCTIKGRGKMFCVPANAEYLENTYIDKSGLGLDYVPFEGVDLQRDAICYKLKCSLPGVDEPLVVTDLFGTRLVSKFKHKMVCVPAVKGAPPDSLCGTFLTAWGSSGSTPGELNAPHGLAIDPGRNAVYVTDLGNDRVQAFSLNGTFIAEWGSSGSGDGELDAPHNLAVAADEVFVVDSGNSRVQVFSYDGMVKRMWGGLGSAAGQFDSPQGIATGPGGVVYVADTNNHRIQKFTAAGVLIGTPWGSQGTANGRFEFPLGVHVTSSGTVYVADTGNDRIQKFTEDGIWQASFGSSGTGDLEFQSPHDVASDDAGRVYVADHDNSRVQVLNGDDGSFYAKWGTIGSGNGQFLLAPHGLGVSADGTVYVADAGNNRIQKFYCGDEQ